MADNIYLSGIWIGIDQPSKDYRILDQRKEYDQQEKWQMTKDLMLKMSIFLHMLYMFILLRPYLWESTTFPLFSSSSKGPN
jgi:hypothetical protein